MVTPLPLYFTQCLGMVNISDINFACIDYAACLVINMLKRLDSNALRAR